MIDLQTMLQAIAKDQGVPVERLKIYSFMEGNEAVFRKDGDLIYCVCTLYSLYWKKMEVQVMTEATIQKAMGKIAQ